MNFIPYSPLDDTMYAAAIQKRLPFYKLSDNRLVNLDQVQTVFWEYPEIRFRIPQGLVIDTVTDQTSFLSEVKRIINRLGWPESDFNLTTEVKIT